MKENKMKDIFNCFIKIQICVLIVYAVTLPLSLLINFVIHNRILQDIIAGVLEIAVEFAGLVLVFSTEKYNDKYLACSTMVKKAAFALIPHFILSLCFRFSAYIAGVGVSTLGCVWYSAATAHYVNEPALVPFVLFIPPMIPMMGLIVLSAYLGFKLADRRIQKERHEVTGK